MTPSPRPSVLRRSALAALVLASGLLSACGGGGSAPDPITVDRLAYGRLSTFTITGTNLTSGVSFSVTGCDGRAALAGGTATQQQFTCTPNAGYQVRMGVSSGGAEFYNASFDVPVPQVTLVTTLGTVVVALDPTKVKLTVDNFLAYVNSGFYNGTIFHRQIKDFVVQGGGFTGVAATTLTPQAPLRANIALETNLGLSNLRGSIAMARGTANNSANSQFYFNAIDNAGLDYSSDSSPGYAVFGKVVSGQAVLDAMNGVPTRNVGPFANVPVTNIVLQTATQTQ